MPPRRAASEDVRMGSVEEDEVEDRKSEERNSQLLLDEYRQFEHGAGVFDEPQAGVLRLTLNRPKRWNAFSSGMHDALPRLFASIADDAAVKGFVLRGSDGVFSSGGDVDENMRERDVGEVIDIVRIGARIITRLLEIPQPTFCMVNGPALGFAASLALSFDFIVAADEAYFQDTHVAFGAVPGDGGAFVWPLAFGPARAREILLASARVPASEAKLVGLINRVVPETQLEDETAELINRVFSMAPLAVRLGKMAVNTPLRAQAEHAMNLSVHAEAVTLLSEDFRRAVNGFIDHGRFDQNWKGR